MKSKSIIILTLFAFLFSCTDRFEEFNTDVKNPATTTGEALFSNAELALTDQVSSTNVNLNVFKLWAQYWTETTYTDEANYNVVNRTVPDLTFREYYRGFLKDFREARDLILKTVPVNAEAEAQKQNKLAIIDFLVVYSYQNLVDIFGDVPYSQALDINNIAPVYDDAATIYRDLITRVDSSLALLDSTAGSYGSADLIYGGDVAKWKKFANSLKVKLGITIADAPGMQDLSKSTVESAVAGGVFTSLQDNAELQYLGAIHTNPLYQDIIQSGRDDFVAANTVVDLMDSLADPRRQFYFTPVGNTYKGGIYGESSPFAQYSHIADPISAPDFPGLLLTYDEVMFYLAEAAARGYNVGAPAVQLYNQAVTASFEWWGGTAAQATAYLAKPEVAFNAADWKRKIGTQSYLAFYTRGLEAFTQWRRLDYPVLNTPPSVQGDYTQLPKRFTYPVNEQTLNKANYESASSAIGGDQLTTRLFWDVE